MNLNFDNYRIALRILVISKLIRIYHIFRDIESFSETIKFDRLKDEEVIDRIKKKYRED